ncbi:rsbT co-antagonist protein RsbR [Mucilaginibacter oryzae]|uniref:RsbT co-antagonist protein RsbR n=1 Tax=Mucilaginibacter oryzae TaxID=468058 RepID=A0A316HJ52_9SPHI|nr:STAS domain-containing protein [Mucilaginibacter oryzae]PWK80060.1 rsbT co-antagonist protein RsbR [Mucilaginibacter oryzae]
MATEITRLFKKNQAAILERWMQNQLADAGLREDLMSNEDLRIESEELIVSLIRALTEDNIDDVNSADFDHVAEILSGISISRARQGYSPRETCLYILSLKEALQQVLNEEIQDVQEQLIALLRVNKLFDNFSIVIFETFIKGREEVILRQTDEITEISTPVIQVWEGILALPIIGTLDSSRTQVIMENLLTAIVDSGSSVAILDISGVPTVDSLVAQHLLKTVSATRLMGAECVISGIRPEIAQTIVHLGIDLSGIVTKASLASALIYAFKTLKLEVRKQGSFKTT